MTLLLLIGIAALAVLASVMNWRHGLFLCVVAGFVQDPLRKITPGQPVVLVVFVAAVFAASIVGAFIRGQRLDGSQLVRWFPSLRNSMSCFAVLVVLQSIATLLRYHNLTLAGIGMLGYLSPLAAIIAFFQFNRAWSDAHRWLRFYVAAAAVMSLTVFLQFLGFSPRIFESIGLDSVYGIGGRIAMLCGIMRSSEVAAFHAGAAACLALTLACIARSRRAQILYASLVPLFLLAIVLGGRRKMLAQFTLYLLTFLFLLVRSRRAFSRATSLISSLVLVVVLIARALFLTGDRQQSALTPYLDRSASVFGGGRRTARVDDGGQHGHRAVDHRRARAGAGTTGQGSQYFGGSENIIAQAPAEGGLGARARRARAARAVVPVLAGLRRAAHHPRRRARRPQQCRPRRPSSSTACVAFIPSHAARLHDRASGLRRSLRPARARRFRRLRDERAPRRARWKLPAPRGRAALSPAQAAAGERR